jgi:uncharacterized protein (DUF305 family)
MERWLPVAVSAAVAAVVAVVVAAATAFVVVQVDDGDGHGAMMSWGGPGMGMGGQGMGPGMGPGDGRGMGPGMGGGMHGPAVTSEYSWLVEMIAHHEEAIDAAGELARSDREEMRDFGDAIVASQSAQVEQMRGWLAEWYPDRPTDADYEAMMRDLTDLDGDDLDRVFLEDMVVHHMAAVMMSQRLLMAGLDRHDEVAALAADISAEQRREIWQMQQWRLEWFG